MGVRAYGRETLASLPIDVDKNMNDRSLSNINSLQVNEHITITARGANRNLHPSLNRYDSETDGWYVSKDNNDIERKFFKDDFSVDSSSQYTGDVGSFTWDTTNKLVKCTAPTSRKRLYTTINEGIGIYSTKVILTNNPGSSAVDFQMFVGRYVIYCYVSASLGTWSCHLRHVSNQSVDIAEMYISPVTEPIVITAALDSASIKLYHNGVLKATYNAGIDTEKGVFGIEAGARITTSVYELTYSPPLSYADDFGTTPVSGSATITLPEVA